MANALKNPWIICDFTSHLGKTENKLEGEHTNTKARVCQLLERRDVKSYPCGSSFVWYDISDGENTIGARFVAARMNELRLHFALDEQMSYPLLRLVKFSTMFLPIDGKTKHPILVVEDVEPLVSQDNVIERPEHIYKRVMKYIKTGSDSTSTASIKSKNISRSVSAAAIVNAATTTSRSNSATSSKQGGTTTVAVQSKPKPKTKRDLLAEWDSPNGLKFTDDILEVDQEDLKLLENLTFGPNPVPRNKMKPPAPTQAKASTQLPKSTTQVDPLSRDYLKFIQSDPASTDGEVEADDDERSTATSESELGPDAWPETDRDESEDDVSDKRDELDAEQAEEEPAPEPDFEGETQSEHEPEPEPQPTSVPKQNAVKEELLSDCPMDAGQADDEDNGEEEDAPPFPITTKRSIPQLQHRDRRHLSAPEIPRVLIPDSDPTISTQSQPTGPSSSNPSQPPARALQPATMMLKRTSTLDHSMAHRAAPTTVPEQVAAVKRKRESSPSQASSPMQAKKKRKKASKCGPPSWINLLDGTSRAPSRRPSTVPTPANPRPKAPEKEEAPVKMEVDRRNVSSPEPTSAQPPPPSTPERLLSPQPMAPPPPIVEPAPNPIVATKPEHEISIKSEPPLTQEKLDMMARNDPTKGWLGGFEVKLAVKPTDRGVLTMGDIARIAKSIRQDRRNEPGWGSD